MYIYIYIYIYIHTYILYIYIYYYDRVAMIDFDGREKFFTERCVAHHVHNADIY